MGRRRAANLRTKIIPIKIRWLETSGSFLWEFHPLTFKILLGSKPLKSRIQRWAPQSGARRGGAGQMPFCQSLQGLLTFTSTGWSFIGMSLLVETPRCCSVVGVGVATLVLKVALFIIQGLVAAAFRSHG